MTIFSRQAERSSTPLPQIHDEVRLYDHLLTGTARYTPDLRARASEVEGPYPLMVQLALPGGPVQVFFDLDVEEVPGNHEIIKRLMAGTLSGEEVLAATEALTYRIRPDPHHRRHLLPER